MVNKNEKANEILFIPCDCRSEILVIDYDYELKLADVAIYQTDAALRSKMSLWQRLRYCWQTLRFKQPYSDQIILNDSNLRSLKNFINSLNLD